MRKWLVAFIISKVIITVTSNEELPVAICLAEGSKFRRPKISTINDTFLSLLTSGNMFVDKTLLIKHLIETGNRIHLIAAPSKFGKSIGLDMLKMFFETSVDADGNLVPRERTRNYKFFANNIIALNHVLLTLKNSLLITQHKDIMDEYQGKYPVIYVDLTSVTTRDFASFLDCMKSAIFKTFKQHEYLMKVLERRMKDDEENKINEVNYHTFSRILNAPRNASVMNVKTSLRFLSALLRNYFNTSTIILIDEYDLPFNKITVDESLTGKNEKIRDLLVDFFDYSLIKNEDNFKMAVLMGTMKLGEKLVFSNISDIWNKHIFEDVKLTSLFGFSEMEVQKILDICRLSVKLHKECHQFYKGYHVSGKQFYNPFSVARFIAEQKLISEWHAPNYVDTFMTKCLWYTSFQNLMLNFAYCDLMEIDLENLLFSKQDKVNVMTALMNRKSNKAMTQEEIHSAMKILFYGGYLTEVSFNNSISIIECPTEEVKMILKNRLLRYYQCLSPYKLGRAQFERVSAIKNRLNKDHKAFQNIEDSHFVKHFSSDFRMMFNSFIRMYSKIMSNFNTT